MRNTKDISGGGEQVEAAIDPAIQDEFAAMISSWQADADNGYAEWLDDCERNEAAAIEAAEHVNA